MTTYLIPADAVFVEAIAMAIAKGRLKGDAVHVLQDMVGIDINMSDALDATFDAVFDKIWAGTSELDMRQKDSYRADAVAAISAINLKLMIT
jgi:hypothetical protein